MGQPAEEGAGAVLRMGAATAALVTAPHDRANQRYLLRNAQTLETAEC